MNTSIAQYDDNGEQQSLLPTNTTDEMLIDMWIASQKSPHTRKQYGLDIKPFLAMLDGKPLQRVTLRNVQRYVAFIDSKPYAQKTKRSKLIVLKSLFTFAHETGYCRFNVGRMIKLPADDTNRATKVLTPEEIYALLNAVKYHQRDHCLLRLIYHCGLRVGEAVGITWDDITPGNNGKGKLFIHGKGDRYRTVILQPDMYQELLAMPHVKTYGMYDSPYVFPGYTGKHLSTIRALGIVKEAAKLAGLGKKVHTHMLRHTHATRAQRMGCELPVLQRSLGHAKVDTTMIYVHLNEDESSSNFVE